MVAPVAAVDVAGIAGRPGVGAARTGPAAVAELGDRRGHHAQRPTRSTFTSGLPHHLNPWKFPPEQLAPFAVLCVLWLVVGRVAPRDPPVRRLRGFVVAGLAIALAGMALSLLDFWDRPTAAGLLRFYWFRLADVALPIGLALLAARWIIALGATAGLPSSASSTVGQANRGTRSFRFGRSTKTRPAGGRGAVGRIARDGLHRSATVFLAASRRPVLGPRRLGGGGPLAGPSRPNALAASPAPRRPPARLRRLAGGLRLGGPAGARAAGGGLPYPAHVADLQVVRPTQRSRHLEGTSPGRPGHRPVVWPHE